MRAFAAAILAGIRNFLPVSARDAEMFKNGGFLAILLILAAALLLMVLKIWFFRRKRLSKLNLPLENGEVEISAGAIADLVKSMGSRFPELEIRKVILFTGKKGPSLLVKTIFHAGGRGIPETGKEFQIRAQHELKESLGIDFVDQIDLAVIKSGKELTH